MKTIPNDQKPKQVQKVQGGSRVEKEFRMGTSLIHLKLI